MSPALAKGTVIAGRYRLAELLGHGGMGLVWRAVHQVTRREVALKVLSGALSHRPEMKLRFLQEARAASAVVHPNVVEIFDVFELEDGTPVMVMALLRGETFGKKLSREFKLGCEETADILLPVVSAAGAAHALGIVHRDLKPDNVFLATEGGRTVVKVLDFGIAKLSPSIAAGDSTVTTTGTLLGTPHYMAPERSFGEKDVDHLADVWSIGAMLYEALTGGRPIEGDNLGQILKNLMTRGITPVSVAVPNLPEDVASLVTRMLTRDRSGRPRDLREVHQVLSKYAKVPAPEFGAPATPRTTSEDGSPPPLPDRPIDEPGQSTTLESPRAADASNRGWSAQTPPSTAVSRPSLPVHRRGWLAATAIAIGVAAIMISWRVRVGQTSTMTGLAASVDASPARPAAPGVDAAETSPPAEVAPTDSSRAIAPTASASARAEASVRSATPTRSKSRTLTIDTASPY